MHSVCIKIRGVFKKFVDFFDNLKNCDVISMICFPHYIKIFAALIYIGIQFVSFKLITMKHSELPGNTHPEHAI